MPRTANNIVRHELIGLDVTVVASTDASRTGTTGRVIDETQKTLLIETSDGDVTVPKSECTFRFELAETAVEVEGGLLVGRPEERILKKFPRKWD